MSYLVLARKWRPQTFDDLVGQDHVGRTLQNAIAADRVHHAFLFTGARGVGKTSAARIFAKALNCAEGPTATPCGVCPSCEAITAGNDVDVFEIDGASNTGVDDVRELRDTIRYLPSRSRYKIIIIDEVHMLSINAFNALLKTLEEPPPHAKFIFATTEPQKIPVTILSRCQRFDFRKVPLPLMTARLRQIADAEGITISDAGVQLVARAGAGSMRDALSTLDQVLAFCGETVRDEEVQTLLGAVDRRLLLDLVEAVLQRDGRRVLDGIHRFDEQGDSFRHLGRELVESFRALLLLQIAEDAAALVDLSDAELRDWQRLAALTTVDDLQRALAILMKTEADLAHAGFPRLTLEMGLLRLVDLPRTRGIDQLLERLDRLERQLAGGVRPPEAPSAPSRPQPAPAAASAPPLPPEPEEPEERGAEPMPEPKPTTPSSTAPAGDWNGLIRFINGKRRAVGSHLEHGQPLALDGDQVEIGYPENSFHLHYWSDAENLEGLQALVSEYFQRPVKVRVKATDKAAAPPSLAQQRAERSGDRRRELEAEVREHPVVRSVLDVFEADIDQIQPLDPGERPDGA